MRRKITRMDKRNKPALIARPVGLCLQIVTMTTNDVTSRYVHRRDVNDADDADWLTTATDALPTDDAGCRLYSFVISSGLIGCLIVFGLVGNSTAFIVFQRDTLKTSTSRLPPPSSFRRVARTTQRLNHHTIGTAGFIK